jgi:hypothetical protein
MQPPLYWRVDYAPPLAAWKKNVYCKLKATSYGLEIIPRSKSGKRRAWYKKRTPIMLTSTSVLYRITTRSNAFSVHTRDGESYDFFCTSDGGETYWMDVVKNQMELHQ